MVRRERLYNQGALSRMSFKGLSTMIPLVNFYTPAKLTTPNFIPVVPQMAFSTNTFNFFALFCLFFASNSFLFIFVSPPSSVASVSNRDLDGRLFYLPQWLISN